MFVCGLYCRAFVLLSVKPVIQIKDTALESSDESDKSKHFLHRYLNEHFLSTDNWAEREKQQSKRHVDWLGWIKDRYRGWQIYKN